jgi:hypothetical protein
MLIGFSAFCCGISIMHSLYLRQNKPAYVEFSESSMKPEDAVAIIKQAGGLAVLAHPWCFKQGKKQEVYC